MFIAKRAAALAASAGMAGLVAGLLAVAAPANAAATVGHPGQSSGLGQHAAPRPAQLQDVDTEI